MPLSTEAGKGHNTTQNSTTRMQKSTTQRKLRIITHEGIVVGCGEEEGTVAEEVVGFAWKRQSLALSKQLIRAAERDRLHAVNDQEVDRLVERWLSDECMQAIMSFFQAKSRL